MTTVSLVERARELSTVGVEAQATSSRATRLSRPRMRPAPVPLTTSRKGWRRRERLSYWARKTRTTFSLERGLSCVALESCRDGGAGDVMRCGEASGVTPRFEKKEEGLNERSQDRIPYAFFCGLIFLSLIFILSSRLVLISDVGALEQIGGITYLLLCVADA